MKMLNSIHPITKYYLKVQKTPGKEGESQLCIEKELDTRNRTLQHIKSTEIPPVHF